MNKLLPGFNKSVEVQFSGKTATYHYLVDDEQFGMLSAAMDERDSAGDVRAVTPGKISGDRLSTSVATVLTIQSPAHPSAELPIIAVVMPQDVKRAKAAVEAQGVPA